jgi:hypothetical protein
MERFLVELKAILPVVGFDLLKPIRRMAAGPPIPKADISTSEGRPTFEIRHKSGVHAEALEENGEMVVLKGSEALKEPGYIANSYRALKDLLIGQGILQMATGGDRYQFTQDYAFDSPSAAAAVVLDRNSNGRIEWKVKGQRQTFHEWQSQSHGQPDLEAAQ